MNIYNEYIYIYKVNIANVLSYLLLFSSFSQNVRKIFLSQIYYI